MNHDLEISVWFTRNRRTKAEICNLYSFVLLHLKVASILFLPQFYLASEQIYRIWFLKAVFGLWIHAGLLLILNRNENCREDNQKN